MNGRIVAAPLLLGLVLAPVAHGQSGRDGKLHELAVELVGRLLDGDQELLSFRLGNQDPPLDSLGRVYAMPTAGADPLWVGIFRNEKPIPSANAARVAIRAGQAAPLLIVRRMTAGSGDPRKVTVSLTEPYGANVTTGQACFTIGDTRKAPGDPDLRHKWLAAANDGLFSAPGAFREYARAKLDSMLEALAPQPARRRSTTRVGVEDQRGRPDPRSLVGLMDTMSGLQSVHEALQTDRHLRTRYHSEPARVALSGLRGPEMRQHPWTAMMAALGRAVPAEPLALAAPARFFYLRFASLTHLFRLLDEADTWITSRRQLSHRDRGNRDD